ncbi:MAG TPA: EAL domain-containing protein [Acidimicrobiales bacterium]|nr:EAL domain-containing protein [Acidimicrobiales bacterium]
MPDTLLTRVMAEAPRLACMLDAGGTVTTARAHNAGPLPRTVDDLGVAADAARAALGGEQTRTFASADDRLYEVWCEPVGDGAMVVVTDLTDVQVIEDRWRALVRDSGQLLAVLGRTGSLEYVSPALRRLVGWSQTHQPARVPDDTVHPEDRPRFRAELTELVAAGAPRLESELRLAGPDGSWRHVEVIVANLADDSRVRGLVLNMRDVTERRLAEAELRRRARQQEIVAVLGHRALSGVDLDVLASEAAAMVRTTLGADLSSVFAVDAEQAKLVLRAGSGWDPDMVGTFRRPVTLGTHAGQALATGAAVVVEDLGRDVRVEGSNTLRRLGMVSGVMVPIQGAERAFGVLGVHTKERRRFGADDIHFLEAAANVLATAAERHQAEEEIRLQSVHDALTKLPNRTLFLDRLQQALRRSARSGRTVAVLFLDIDRFKVVNDGLGHVVGDMLLKEVASRLQDLVRPSDTVARFGGDEFVVLCDDLDAESDAVDVAERVAQALRRPFVLSGREVVSGASVGIAAATGNDHDGAEALVRDADAAMYRAKDRGKGRYEVFNEAIRRQAVRRLETEQALGRAVARGELRVEFQPGINLQTGNIAAVEALVRWQHPQRGLVGPADFIPVAEETGLIVPVGEWVLAQAVDLAAQLQWAASDGGAMTVAVNLSARQLAAPGLVDRVAGLLREYDLPPRALSLEITESVLMEDAEAARRMLVSLKDVGVYLAVDDFGTGYSSLAYLRRFPVDALKIDKSFVDGLGREAEDSAIVRAIVSLAKTLGLDTVAEGVETEAQRDELVALECTYAQGFLWSPAVPVAELELLLRAEVPLASA